MSGGTAHPPRRPQCVCPWCSAAAEWKDGRLHDDPLGVGARDDARARLPHRRPARRLARPTPTRRRCGAPRPRRCARGSPGPRRTARSRSTSSCGAWTEDVLPFMSRVRAPALLRLHPRQRHLARRARRLHRERGEHLRGLAGWRRPARARSSSRCSAGSRTGSATRRRRGGMLVSGGSAANMTALACAREALVGAMTRRPRRLRLRPGALVARARRRASSASGPSRCACCRSTTASGSRPATLAARDRGRRARRPPAALRLRQRRQRRTPARSIRCRSSPRSAASTASGCTSTPPTAGSPR